MLPLPGNRERSQRDPDLRHLRHGPDRLPPDAEHLLLLGGLMHDFSGDFYHPLAVTMVDTLASVGPVACLPASTPDDYRYWPEVSTTARGTCSDVRRRAPTAQPCRSAAPAFGARCEHWQSRRSSGRL
jgi:hypothetical protein